MAREVTSIAPLAWSQLIQELQQMLQRYVAKFVNSVSLTKLYCLLKAAAFYWILTQVVVYTLTGLSKPFSKSIRLSKAKKANIF